MNFMKHVYYTWIGKRGEFTIKKKAREILGIKPGDYVIVSHRKKRNLVIIKKAKPSDLKRYRK